MVNVQHFLPGKVDIKNNEIGVFIEHVAGLFHFQRVATTVKCDHEVETQLGN